MNHRLQTTLIVGASLAALAGGGWAVARNRLAHMVAMSGQPDASQVTCFHCHMVSTNRMPWARPRTPHDTPAGLAVSPDGSRLYIALEERDQIAVADTTTLDVLRRFPIAGRPFGLALNSAGTRLFVACRDADRVVALDAATGEVLEQAQVGSAPVAAAYCDTPAGARLVVANSMSDDISMLALDPLREISRLAAGREPFGVAANHDGTIAFVSSRMSALITSHEIPASEVTAVDPASGRPVHRESLPSAHLSEGVVTVPARGWTLVPLVNVRNLVPITQVADGWVMSSAFAVLDPRGGTLATLPLDEANAYYADPSGIAADPAGRRAYIAAAGINAVSIIDLDAVAKWLLTATPTERAATPRDLSLASTYVSARIPTGHNPKHLALSPDGNTLFVAERLQDSILVVDTVSLQPRGRIVLGDGGDHDPLRRGERLFNDASYTFQNQFSCRSCHPDGHVDGLSYDFDIDGIGDNLLDNRSLHGVGGTAPFKWNGKNVSLEMQCGPRFAKVLMRTDPFPEDKLRELAAFIRSQPPPRIPRLVDGKLTPAQQRGRDLFFATHTPDGTPIPYFNRCDTCHRPPLYTVRLPFSVGTQSATDVSGLFDTPHLLGIGVTAPYLHDGRAKSLEEIWTVYSTRDEHGVTSYMNKIQLNDLVEFLKIL
jgi:YVTN family beta-propeller protein